MLKLPFITQKQLFITLKLPFITFMQTLITTVVFFGSFYIFVKNIFYYGTTRCKYR